MKLKQFFAGALVASVLLTACGGGASKDPITLKFNMGKGQKFNYTMEVDMAMKQAMMGKEMDIKNKMTMGYDFAVTGDSSGWKTMAGTIARMGMDVNAMGMTMKFDSETPGDTSGPMGVVGKVFSAMKGGQFTFTMNEKGEVGEVRGMKEMMEKTMNSLNVPNAEQMFAGISQGFDENAMKQNMQQSFNMYPDKPVKAGDSWSKTMTTSTQGMKMKMDNTYTLESVQGDVATVKVVAKISSAADTTSAMKIDMTGNSDGSVKYDIPTGMPIDGNMNMKIAMKMAGLDKPMDMNMKMTMKGKKL